MRFEPHAIDWTPDKIRRFWDSYSTTEGLEDTYFSRVHGRAIVEYVSRRIRIGAAVDIGCGRGDLIAALIESGHKAGGIDQSTDSLELVRKRFAGNPLFTGAGKLPPADTAFMIEVVEHMDDDALSEALETIRRTVKPGGRIVITTPNDEHLELLTRTCPDCGCRFHTMQHVRSWSALSLTGYMISKGFRTVSCEAIRLTPRTGMVGTADRLAHRLLGRLPNLVYIGEVSRTLDLGEVS